MKLHLLLIPLCFSAHLSRAIPGCPANGSPRAPAFAGVQAQIGQRITVFAAYPAVGLRADQAFASLSQAKSPVIAAWIKNSQMAKATSKEIAAAWRIYYAKHFVLPQYPQSSSEINQEIETLIDGIFSAVLPAAKRTELEKIFLVTQKLALKRVETFALDESTKRAVIAKIGAIRLYWPKEFKTSKYKSYPLEAISWGVAYDPVNNEVNVGVDALKYADRQTLMAVFAHEIGHAFDPCRWSSFFGGANPFESVTRCLRTDRSVGALSRDDSTLDAMVKSGSVAKDLAVSLRANPTCNQMAYPPIGVQADQILESFADWFSAEVISLQKLDTMPRKDLCEANELNPGSAYPTNSERLARIYLAQPVIRAAAKLPADTTLAYCELGSAPVTTMGSLVKTKCDWCIETDNEFGNKVIRFATLPHTEMLKKLQHEGILVKTFTANRKFNPKTFHWGKLVPPKLKMNEIGKDPGLTGKTLCRGEIPAAAEGMTIAIADDAPKSTLIHEYLHTKQIANLPGWCAASKQAWQSGKMSTTDYANRLTAEWDVHKWLWLNKERLHLNVEDKVNIASNLIDRAKDYQQIDAAAANDFLRQHQVEAYLQKVIPEYMEYLKTL